MLKVNKNISLNEDELKFDFVKASGPGGQNVNKVATAVQLRFDVLNSKCINEKNKFELIKKAGKKITKNGVLIIEAKRYRTQEKNKQDAIERLILLIKNAVKVKKQRTKTKPTKASLEKRIESKKKKSQIKKLRKNTNSLFE